MLFGPGSTHLLEPVEREFGDRVGRIVGHEVGCVVDERELEPIGEPLGPTAEMTHERLGNGPSCRPKATSVGGRSLRRR